MSEPEARRHRRLQVPAGQLDRLHQAPDRPSRRPHPDDGRACSTSTHARSRRRRSTTMSRSIGGEPRNIPRYRETLPNGVSYEVLDRDTQGNLDNTQVFVVPEGHYFMMGDNRDNSADSRVDVGYVPFENFVGKAQIIFFSTNGEARDLGSLEVAFRNPVRPARPLRRVRTPSLRLEATPSPPVRRPIPAHARALACQHRQRIERAPGIPRRPRAGLDRRRAPLFRLSRGDRRRPRGSPQPSRQARSLREGGGGRGPRAAI